MADRVPPHSQDAEQALLGGMLLDGDRLVLAKVFTILPLCGAFYSAAHRRIFDVIRTLYDSKEPVDITTVSLELERRDELTDSGGRAYVAGLASNVATAANVEYYAGVVLEKYKLRKIIEIASDIVNQGYRQEKLPGELADEASALLLESAVSTEREPVRLISTYMVPIIEHIGKIQAKETEPGIMTQYPRLDNMTVGFQRGELTVIIGRPGNGKTSFADNVASNIAISGHKVYMASAEMSGHAFATRTLCTQGMLNSMALRKGLVSDEDWATISETAGIIGSWKYWIDARSRININELVGQVHRMKMQEGCDIVFVDYLQRVKPVGKFYSRYEAVGQVTESLSDLAKDLDIPVVANAQIKREVDRRPDPTPTISDIRESGEIEQTADNVWAIHRPELYASKEDKKNGRLSGAADVIILKARNGTTGKVEFYFDRTHTKFSELQTTFTEGF